MNMKTLKIWLFTLSTLLIPMTSQAAGTDPYKYKGFTSMDGKKHSFNDFRGKGKWLVVMVWRKDCHVCNQEVHQYMAFHKKHKDTLATVIGISVDGPEGKAKAQSFIKRHKVNFPTMLISSQMFGSLYHAMSGKQFRGTPTIMIYARDGSHKGQQAGAVPSSIIEKFIMDKEKAKVSKR